MEGLARAAAAMRCAAADRRGGGSRAARLVARLPAEAPPRAASLIALQPAHQGLSMSCTGARVDHELSQAGVAVRKRDPKQHGF